MQLTMHSSKTYAVACFCCERDNPSHSMTQSEVVVCVYFLRADAKLSIYILTCRVTVTQHAVL